MSKEYREALRSNSRCRACSNIIPRGQPAFFGGNWQGAAIICDKCLDAIFEAREEYRKEKRDGQQHQG